MCPGRDGDMVPTAIDLFAGGGGLTVGMRRAGFRVVSAVENEVHAANTYATNHPEARLLVKDIRLVDGGDLLKVSPTGQVDLIAGCPPCQGFTSLTSKYHRDDPRNELIKEMSRLVEEIQPRAVMLENVPGLADRGRHLLDGFCDRLRLAGYDVTAAILQVADYGVPQRRRRLVVLAGKGFPIRMPAPTHSRDGTAGASRWRSVRDAIGHLGPPVTLSEANRNGGPRAVGWHVVRNITDRNRTRLATAKPGETWISLPAALRPACHQGDYVGFTNVYGLMLWDAAAPTITAGCTTPSKGRFGHPDGGRTISVREAALLQGFPQDYVIDTPYIDYACDIVGNALPCPFAAAVAAECMRALLAPAPRPATG